VLPEQETLFELNEQPVRGTSARPLASRPAASRGERVVEDMPRD
jgi:hypothetical protein